MVVDAWEYDSGFCTLEDDGSNEFFEMKGMKYEESGSVSLSPDEIKPDVSPSFATGSKGCGLKKWRRIKRDSNKVKDGGVDTGNIMVKGVPDSGENSSKRIQVVYERMKKSECSILSMNTMVRSFDGFDLHGVPGLATGLPFAAGIGLENGENQSSNSTTPARAPTIRGETSVVMRFPHDKSKARSVSGKNLIHQTLSDQQGKGRIGASKKSRGEKVNIEKENSHSSVESDLQSFNFVFMQGTERNGIKNEISADYDEDNGDEVQDIEHRCSNEPHGDHSKDGEGGYDGFSPERADSSCEAKDETRQKNGSSTDVDPLAESILALQSVKEALENEVLNLRELRKDVSVDDLFQDSPPESTDNKKLKETSSELFQSGENMRSFSFASQSEVLETENRDAETDIEQLFKQKIEDDVEYLAISRTVQNLKVAALDQINMWEDQKNLVSKQAQLLHKLGETEKKALILNKEAEKLENFCEDITRADEILNMQKSVYKYTSCFFTQLVALIFVLGIFIFQLSPQYIDLAPT